MLTVLLADARDTREHHSPSITLMVASATDKISPIHQWLGVLATHGTMRMGATMISIPSLLHL